MEGRDIIIENEESGTRENVVMPPSELSLVDQAIYILVRVSHNSPLYKYTRKLFFI